MAQIYSEAQCVDIWLGGPGPQRPFNWYAVLDLPNILRQIGSRRHDLDEVKFEPLRLVWSMLQNDCLLIKRALQSTSSAWHERGWVMQEYIRSRKAYLCLGRSRTPFTLNWSLVMISMSSILPNSLSARSEYFLLDSFNRCTSAKFRWALDRYRIGNGGDFGPSEGLTTMHNRAGGERKNELVSGLEAFAADSVGMKTSDPRDMVYSLLAPLPASEATMISVDYSAPVWEVFALVTWVSMFVTMQRQSDLSIWTLVRMTNREVEHLPSWSVDFTDANKNRAMFSKVIQTEKFVSNGETATLVNDPRYLGLNAAVGDIVTSIVALEGVDLPAISIGEEIQNLLVTAFLAMQHHVECAKSTSGESPNAIFRQLISKYRAMAPGFEAPDGTQGFNRMIDIGYDDDLHRLPFTIWHGVVLAMREHDGAPADLAKLPDSALADQEGGKALAQSGTPLNSRLMNAILAAESNAKQIRSGPKWNSDVKKNFLEYCEYAHSASHGPSLVATSSGFIGLAPRTVEEGDVIAMVESDCPFVLMRPAHDPNAPDSDGRRVHKFGGFICIHGLHDNSFWDQWEVQINLTRMILV